MIVHESPDRFAHPLYIIADDYMIPDYINADAHTLRDDDDAPTHRQGPDRDRIVIINGWPYIRDHIVPLDLLWKAAAA